jgi:2-polyprenyl-3-methyl-5-hydroxy-6-metoxy-1,4-benzoquinol methylase
MFDRLFPATNNRGLPSYNRSRDLRHRSAFTTTQARLLAITKEYPASQRSHEIADVPRVAYNVDMALLGAQPGSRVVDVGGGLGLFSLGVAALGMNSVLIDDFCDPGNVMVADEILELHRRYGVEVIRRDVIAHGVDFQPASVDIVTTFDSIEHWHHSPKRLLHQLVAALKPGGRIVIGSANCVNLRKRITVPLGYGKWSAMTDWYEQETFRSHVREPDVADMRHIGDDLQLCNIKIVGWNWLGYESRHGWVRSLAPFADPLLRFFPSLCSNLYLIGTKPQ